MIHAAVKKNLSHPGTWDLFINDRLEIEAESFTVCANVVDALKRGADGTSEADEVAAGILRAETEIREKSNFQLYAGALRFIDSMK